MSSSAATIVKKVRRRVKKAAYGNAVYQKILSAGDATDRIHFAPPDLWPGDAQAGMALLAVQPSMFAKPAIAPDPATDLRNLRAVGTDAARHAAVKLIANGLAQCEGWSETEWTQNILGARIAAWIGFYEFYAPALPPGFAQKLAASLQRQWKHLLRTLTPAHSLSNIDAIRGLVYGGLNFPEGEKALGLACDLLRRQLDAEILADGAHISRSPSVQLHLLRHLVDLRTVFRSASLPLPDEAALVIAAMVPALKFYRHGDGGLALFHGSVEETPLLIDAVLTQAEAKGSKPRRLPQAAYERVTAGRSLLIADCGAPSVSGHAGLLAFEFGQGRERIIVNCGSYDTAPEWHAALAATAAHSTLTLNETNAAEIFPGGTLRFTGECSAQRYEQAGAQGLEMSHGGYRADYGVIHRRILELSGDGDELRGRDVLEGPAGISFNIRWHLHPALQASLSHGGQTALLRTPSGAGWRLRITTGQLDLEPSIYCGTGAPRRTLQLKASGITQAPETSLVWSLAREKKG
jgi:uncharacterized heparinase superfamily protein